LRKKIEIQTKIKFGIREDQKIVTDFHMKYNKLDELLEKNSSMIELIHCDLAPLGVDSGRLARFSTSTLFRSILVRVIEQLSFRDLIIRLDDSMFLRNFIQIGLDPVMGFTLIETAQKLIQPATWEKINLLLTQFALREKHISGTALRLDSTVTESNIHYPTDSSLLWDCYRTIANLQTCLYNETIVKRSAHRFHLKKIKRLHTFISTQSSAKKPSTKKKVAKTLRILLERVNVVNDNAEAFIKTAIGNVQSEGLLLEFQKTVEISRKIVDQIKKVHVDKIDVKGCDKIYSLFETHSELLMRGKSHKPNEFGHLVSIGQTKEKYISFYKVEEKSQHDTAYKTIALEDHKELFGSYPVAFVADKNYYEGMDDIEEWEEKIPLFAIAKKGRRNSHEEEREHSVAFKALQAFRAGCEGTISVLKRAFGLKRCLLRSFKSFESSIGASVFCHNLVLLAGLT